MKTETKVQHTPTPFPWEGMKITEQDRLKIIHVLNCHQELIKAFRHTTECPDRGTALCGECAASYRAVAKAEFL